MADLLRWRKRNGLNQAEAALVLGISQPYLSLLESGARPLTAELRNRSRTFRAKDGQAPRDDFFRAQLSALGYPGFAHVAKSRRRPRPDNLLMAILSQPDADARVVEALPWLAAALGSQLDFGSVVRQAKLRNLQNRLGFILQLSAVDTPGGLAALRELERSRLLQEDTLCWDSMTAPAREWMRANRTPLARHWNILTRLSSEGVHRAV